MTTQDARPIKIEVKNLTKRFGDLLVLDDMNFTIRKGEFLAIVGPTGCGKTTFLNCLSKLMPTSEGDIYIDGEPANPQKHNISFVFQEPTCFPWRTVRENVAYGMEIKRWDKKLIEGKLDAILPLVGLADTAELYPNQVSASMVQRIAVARAFAVEPDLLMMDEPYGTARHQAALLSGGRAGQAVEGPRIDGPFRHPQHRRGGLRGGAHPRPHQQAHQHQEGDRRGSAPPEGHRIRRLHPHPQTGHRANPLVVTPRRGFPPHATLSRRSFT